MTAVLAARDELVAEVYDALLGTGDWTRFLSRLATVLPDGRAMMVHHDAGAGHGALHLHVNVPPSWREAYDGHFSRINPWMPIAARRPLGVATNTSAMLAQGLLHRTEFYGDFLRQLNFREGVGITLERERDLSFALSILGSDAGEDAVRDAKTVLESVAPHLRRAFTFYRATSGRASGLGLDALQSHLAIGLVRVGLRGTVLSANATADAILAQRRGVFLDRAGRLTSADKRVDQELQAQWAVWTPVRDEPLVRSWLVDRGDARLPLRVSLIRPKREGAQTFFSGPEAFVLIEDPERTVDAGAELAAFFGLTAAETRVLADLALGHGPATIAKTRRISVATVRTHLKHLLAKTGCGTQADLVRLAHRFNSVVRR